MNRGEVPLLIMETPHLHSSTQNTLTKIIAVANSVSMFQNKLYCISTFLVTKSYNA